MDECKPLVCGDVVKFGTSHPELLLSDGSPGKPLKEVCGFDIFSVGSFTVEYSWVDNWGLRGVATRTINVRQSCASPEFVCVADITVCSVGGGYCPGDPLLYEDVAPPEDTAPVLLLNVVDGVVAGAYTRPLSGST